MDGDPGKVRSNSYLINITEDIFIALITKEMPRVLGALCQKWWQRPNIYFYYESHHNWLLALRLSSSVTFRSHFIFLCLKFSSINEAKKSTYFTDTLWGWNELIPLKPLEWSSLWCWTSVDIRAKGPHQRVLSSTVHKFKYQRGEGKLGGFSKGKRTFKRQDDRKKEKLSRINYWKMRAGFMAPTD